MKLKTLNYSSKQKQVDSSQRRGNNDFQSMLSNSYPSNSYPSNSYPSQPKRGPYGWDKYGCAGDDQCLPSKNGRVYFQPNGNKYCSTNFPSLSIARDTCNKLNSYQSGSCTHITTYQMHTGESRWELLNINAVKKCLLYFNTDIDDINQRSRFFNIRITLNTLNLSAINLFLDAHRKLKLRLTFGIMEIFRFSRRKYFIPKKT